MYILFEETIYPTSKLQKVLKSDFYINISIENSKINHVGYYSERDRGPVLILPKIFLLEGCFFGIPYQQFLDTKAERLIDKSTLSTLNELVIKFYLSIKKYSSNYFGLSNIKDFAIVSNLGSESTTRLDVMLSLIEFNKKNPYIFMNKNTVRNSGTAKKVKWNKVMNKATSFIIDDKIVYSNYIVNKKIQGNEDILLILYYNLLVELKFLDPKITLPENIKILSSKDFQLLKNKAVSILKRIKNHYFQDTYKKIWSLLFLYFKLSESKKGNDRSEYLLISNYELVFEKMVDYLLSDRDLIEKYKYLKDNKEVDHLFKSRDILGLGDIIYIGDSKYYANPNNIRHTRYKQFTYAKNILMENIQLEIDKKSDEVSFNYRDDITEGYNSTPNFFIYGYVEKDITYNDGILLVNDMMEKSYHFNNRFFDRDSLHIFYFKINYVFLLETYINKDIRFIVRKKANIQEYISNKIREYIFSMYDFYIVENTPNNLDFILKNFKLLIGKTFISSFKKEAIFLCLNKEVNEEKREIINLLNSENIAFARYMP